MFAIKESLLKRVVPIVAAGILGSQGASAATLDLPATGYLTYGNVNSYSLPILANIYDIANGGGTGPGNPYYIPSGPGQIQDFIVVYTGASGVNVRTNTAGFDNAYLTPSGVQGPFANTSPLEMTAPNPAGKAIANNLGTTWDADVAAFNTFLGAGNKPVFFFNNNDTNSDQNLAIWAKAWITTPTNGVYKDRYLYLSNTMLPYGTGGVPNGNATTYNPGNLAQPGVGGFPVTDYVLSGGTLCVDAVGAVVACGSPAAVKTINHNLGANQAAYAADIPLLNQFLFEIGQSTDYTFHLELYLGCDPRIGTTTCDNFKIDNGFEQLFIASTGSNITVPEPASIALLGLGLLGLGFGARKRMR